MSAPAPFGTRQSAAARKAGQGRIASLATALLVCAIQLPAIASVGLRTDTAAHLRFADAMALTGRAFGPYYLFEQLTIIVRALVPYEALAVAMPRLGDRSMTWEVSGTIVLLGFIALLAVLVHHRLYTDLTCDGRARPALAAAGLTVTLMMVAPITFLTWDRHQLLVGYVSITSFESATAIVSRPVSLLLFWLVADRMWARASPRMVLAVAGLSLLAMHAKPSYSICLLPAAAVLVAARAVRRRPVDWRLWWLGIVAPTVCGAGFQLLVSRGEGGIGLEPFAVLRQVLDSRGLSAWWFVPLLCLSALFPIAVAALHPAAVRSSMRLQLAWVTFIAGLTIFCLFTVTGRRDYGDLLWGAQIGLFVLFVESVREWLVTTPRSDVGRSASRRGSARGVVLSTVLLAHLVCGFVLWYHEIVTPAAWW